MFALAMLLISHLELMVGDAHVIRYGYSFIEYHGIN